MTNVIAQYNITKCRNGSSNSSGVSDRLLKIIQKLQKLDSTENTLKNIEAILENLETRMKRLEDFGAMAEQDIKPPNDSNTQMNK